MTTKLSPKMIAALKLLASTEPGNDTLNEGAGIMPTWMIRNSTHCALIDRGMVTPSRMVYSSERDDRGLPTRSFGPLVQITSPGCEAIGRSMDEIVAWAWDRAMNEYEAQSWFVSSATIMTTLPAEVGAVVGWTHKGEVITGEIKYIADGVARVVAKDGGKWAVTLDEIERVIELAPATCPAGHVAAPRTDAGTCAECEQPKTTQIKPAQWNGVPGQYTAYTDEGSYMIVKHGNYDWWAYNLSLSPGLLGRSVCSGQTKLSDAKRYVDEQRKEIHRARVHDVETARQLAIVEHRERGHRAPLTAREAFGALVATLRANHGGDVAFWGPEVNKLAAVLGFEGVDSQRKSDRLI